MCVCTINVILCNLVSGGGGKGAIKLLASSYPSPFSPLNSLTPHLLISSCSALVLPGTKEGSVDSLLKNCPVRVFYCPGVCPLLSLTNIVITDVSQYSTLRVCIRTVVGTTWSRNGIWEIYTHSSKVVIMSTATGSLFSSSFTEWRGKQRVAI